MYKIESIFENIAEIFAVKASREFILVVSEKLVF